MKHLLGVDSSNISFSYTLKTELLTKLNPQPVCTRLFCPACSHPTLPWSAEMDPFFYLIFNRTGTQHIFSLKITVKQKSTASAYIFMFISSLFHHLVVCELIFSISISWKVPFPLTAHFFMQIFKFEMDTLYASQSVIGGESVRNSLVCETRDLMFPNG